MLETPESDSTNAGILQHSGERRQKEAVAQLHFWSDGVAADSESARMKPPPGRWGNEEGNEWAALVSLLL